MRSYNKCVEMLLSLQFSGIKLGLEQIELLLNELGDPQNGLKFIHLAGTNGKGSTGALISSSLSAVGYKTAFYTSPHLFDIRERFRIDGKAVSEKLFAECANQIIDVIEDLKKKNIFITFFEATTALAIKIFGSDNAEFVVWETGLGGRFDATNVVVPLCSILTGIAKDHESFLGDTVVEIAGEKAGIIKSSVPAFVGYVSDDVRAVFAAEALKKDAPISFIQDIVPEAQRPVLSLSEGVQIAPLVTGDVAVSLLGDIQVRNALLAEMTLSYLSTVFGFDLTDALQGMSCVTWPGRFQIIENRFVVDGAHNPDGAGVLRTNIETFFPEETFSVIFGSFCDKDTQGVINELSHIAKRFIFTPLNSDRPYRSFDELAEMASKDIDVESAISAEDAVSKALMFDEKIIVAGSLFLSGEVLSLPHFTINLLDIY